MKKNQKIEVSSQFAEDFKAFREQNHGIVQIPVDVLYESKLSHEAKLIFFAVIGLCYQKGYCYASTDTLCSKLNMGRTTFNKYLKELDEAEFVRREHHDTEKGRRRKIFIEFDFLKARYKTNVMEGNRDEVYK